MLDEDKLRDLNTQLNAFGFELLDNSRTRLIDQIKNLVIERIYRSDDPEEKVNWSKLISDQAFHEYNYLSTLFGNSSGYCLPLCIRAGNPNRDHGSHGWRWNK